MLRKISQVVGWWMTNLIKKKYLKYYPIHPDLVNLINKNATNPKDRINLLNKIRCNNILSIYWSNAGTVFGLLITLMSFAFSIFWALSSISDWTIAYLEQTYSYTPKESSLFVFLFLFRAAIICVTYIILISLTPILLRKVIINLPAKQYAEFSLSNLNQSEILTFVAYKMWLLCNRFCTDVIIPKRYRDITDLEKDEFFDKKYKKLRGKIIEDTKDLQHAITKFKARYYNDLNKCTELKHEALSKLDILPTEFCHHILKFSTFIFEVRIDTFKRDIDTILFIVESGSLFEDPKFMYILKDGLKEVLRITNDIRYRRMKALGQLVLFDVIHEYIIGLSSAISTSQSLQIFSRGISELARGSNEELLALLHRSKAHYGMDLLISLENFYKKKYKPTDDRYNIPEILYNIKYAKALRLDPMILISDASHFLKNIRDDLMEEYKDAMEELISKFKNHINEVNAKENENEKYLIVFGYSRIVRNVLKESAELLRENRYKIFVMKEANSSMLDTRMFRFELNDQKPDHNIRESFTASDSFIFRLIKEKDSVVMLAGAEAFITVGSRLLHTNNYQERVENLIDRLENARDKPDPEIWIVAGRYKIYKSFPENDSFFGNEFYSDHYDKVDLYDFSHIKQDGRLKLITNGT